MYQKQYPEQSHSGAIQAERLVPGFVRTRSIVLEKKGSIKTVIIEKKGYSDQH